MNIRPMGNNLLIRRAPADATSKGGIILPDSAQTKPQRGTVVAAGPGYRTENGVLVKTTCAPGDVIIFADLVGHEVAVDGENLVVLSEDVVIAVVEVDE